MPTPNAPPVPDRTTLDHSEQNATQALYRAVVGSVNSGYYVPIFSRFEAEGRAGMQWNTAASLYTLNWMLFRRLWGAALIYVAAMLGGALLLFGLARLFISYSRDVEVLLVVVALALSFVLPGLYGNAWLYGASRRRMAQALRDSATWEQACALLEQQASSRQRFIKQVAINTLLLAVLLGLYLVFPQLRLITPPQALTDKPVEPETRPLVDISTTPPDATSAVPVLSAAPAPQPPTPTPVALPTLPVTPPALPAPPATAQVFIINVGLFAEPANASRAYHRLKRAGLPVLTKTLKMKRGPRFQIRVGPFATRAEAEAVAISVRALQLDAMVAQP